MTKGLRLFGTTPTLLILLTIGVNAGFAAGGAIGTVSSTGRFELGGVETWKEGTLMDGAAIATNRTLSRLRLSSGAEIRVGAEAKAWVYENRLVVEKGTVDAAIPNEYSIEAAPLGVRVSGNRARAQLRVDHSGGTLIASVKGALRVYGPDGLLLANLAEGNAVQLSATSGAKATAQLTGIVLSKQRSYLLSDETSGVTVELRGGQVAKFAGKRVTITGDVEADQAPVAGGDFVVRVRTIEDQSLPASASNGSNRSKSTRIGIITGIAVAGVVSAGLVVPGEEEIPERVSPQP